MLGVAKNLFGILGGGDQPSRNAKPRNSVLPSKSKRQQVKNMSAAPVDIKKSLPFDQKELLSVIDATEKQKLDLINSVKRSIEKVN